MSTESWPEDRLPLAKIKDWIKANLPGQPQVDGPTHIYGIKDWGVTACFSVGNSSNVENVVFKSPLLPLSFPCGIVYELLSNHCSGAVPNLLARTELEGCRWLLFRPFQGERIQNLNSVEALCDLARAYADIQTTIADLPAQLKTQIPGQTVTTLIARYEELLITVEDRYLDFWRTENSHEVEGGSSPPVLDRLKACRSWVVDWVEELVAGNWPISINHIDLHPNNAVMQPEGQVLIYDWDEALLGFPFLSLDKLLSAAQELAEEAEVFAGEKGADGQVWDPVSAVRQAYLNSLSWGTLTAREQAFDLANLLSPIHRAYADWCWLQAMGWGPEEEAKSLARCLIGAVENWEKRAA